MTKPEIYCLTPVKNEEWIIERFLKAASLWADKIIISDQGSTDRTVEIAKTFPKVILLDNSQLKEFNEQEMRAPLFAEARKYPGKKLLISLDADEILTPNFDSPEWDTIYNAEEGTRFVFDWLHIMPDLKSYFTTIDNTCAFIDDGEEYNVGLIHVPRQPCPTKGVKTIKLNDVRILHFQFTNWERMERKHIWYQMYERIYYPQKSCVSIFRGLHYDKCFLENNKTYPLKKEWLDLYKSYNIDITSVISVPSYIWDQKILEYIATQPPKYFNRIDTWDINWANKVEDHGGVDKSKFLDRRSFIDKLVIRYLRHTQKIKDKIWVKIFDRMLKLFI